MTTIQATQRPNVRNHIAIDSQPKPHASKRRRLSSTVVSVMLVARCNAMANAGPTFQAPELQGTARPSSRPARIEVQHFAGDTVHGTVWDEAGTEHRDMRLHPRDLVGMHWTFEACDDARCEDLTYRITEVARDTSTNTMPQHGDNDDVWLYRVEYALPSTPDTWRGVCDEGNADTTMGLFVDGHWTDDGTWHPQGWTYTCPSGVIAKCVRSWGYKPWKILTSPICGEVDLQPLHQACTRAARADYCGDGNSHTRDGTLVDLFDACGFNVREGAPGFHEESAFDEHGARSVSIPRWPTGTSTATGWRFATCERPRQAPQKRDAALIHVWSDPTKGRGAAGLPRE